MSVRPNWIDGNEIDFVVRRVLNAARIPGGAVAVVANGQIVHAAGYGFRDIESRQKVGMNTIYPIASTTKAMNATLLGMLIDEGVLEWDAPIQRYIPNFQLCDSISSSRVTVRDLITMRTGLPRHEWMWLAHPLHRADLTDRLRHLDLSAGFRERFQYCNLTVIVAGHIAEVIMGKAWEELITERIFQPLGMTDTVLSPETTSDMTVSYHETRDRALIVSPRFETRCAGPCGGSINSTVSDMARWILFNLSDGRAGEKQLIKVETLSEIHRAQLPVETDESAPSKNSAYALGWFVDRYNGRRWISHSGYLHEVHSDVSLFPDEKIGIVAFTNFGAPRMSTYITRCVSDLLIGTVTDDSLERRLSEYEGKVADTQKKRTALIYGQENIVHSLPLGSYEGVYNHPGYGDITIQLSNSELVLQRDNLKFKLRHQSANTWVPHENNLFPIHETHSFDSAGAVAFHEDAFGEIARLDILLEPLVDPIQFTKLSAGR